MIGPPIKNPKKTYLGDSVYIENDGYVLKLTTDNGEGPSNTIVLEPEVSLALMTHLKKELGE